MLWCMDPDLYHGDQAIGNFFEGWYFRICDREAKRSVAFIPGICRDNSGRSEAFVQMIDSLGATSVYLPFDGTDFAAASGRLQLRVAKSRFSLKGMDIDLGTHARGSVKFTHLQSWPGRFGIKGSMGLLNQLNFLECYTQVIAMNGHIHGSLSLTSPHGFSHGGSRFGECCYPS